MDSLWKWNASVVTHPTTTWPPKRCYLELYPWDTRLFRNIDQESSIGGHGYSTFLSPLIKGICRMCCPLRDQLSSPLFMTPP